MMSVKVNKLADTEAIMQVIAQVAVDAAKVAVLEISGEVRRQTIHVIQNGTRHKTH